VQISMRDSPEDSKQKISFLSLFIAAAKLMESVQLGGILLDRN
jgi:hypothetical protein